MPEYDFLKTEPVHGPAFKPQSIEEVDVRQSVLEDIALKTLYLSGSLSILELSERTKLSFEVAKELAFHLRTEMLCQVNGMTGNSTFWNGYCACPSLAALIFSYHLPQT